MAGQLYSWESKAESLTNERLKILIGGQEHVGKSLRWINKRNEISEQITRTCDIYDNNSHSKARESSSDTKMTMTHIPVDWRDGSEGPRRHLFL